MSAGENDSKLPPGDAEPSKGRTPLKQWWFDYVRRQTVKTAADPNAKAKLIAGVLILLLIAWRLPRSEASIIACAPCVTWAASFCTSVVAAGGACAAVAAFPPLLCACLLASGGLVCAGAAATCVVVCALPTP